MNNKNKLLIITQKVDKNDFVLGFFHAWILEFAKHCKELIVICLEKGEYDLPSNVTVLSLGKEYNVSKLVYVLRFYKYIWQYRKQYNNVFVHMNVEYVVLGGVLWRLLNKKIGLWYMHKSVTWKLRLAEKLSTVIFTGSKESFRLKSQKLKVLHHGIDSDLFAKKERQYNQDLNLLTIGRISKIKNIDLMLDLVYALKGIVKNINLKIIGGCITNDDMEYLNNLKKKVEDLDLEQHVEFLGEVVHNDLPNFYHKADIVLNFSQTGSIDKVLLEAMSCGTLILTTNDSMYFLPEKLFCKSNDVDILKDRILSIYELDIDNKSKLVEMLRDVVVREHSLSDLIKNILKNYEKTSR